MDTLDIEGKAFVSARRAAKEYGYTTDYIGQLIRAQKLVGQKVGRAWYVAQDSLEAYAKVGEIVEASKSVAPAANANRPLLTRDTYARSNQETKSISYPPLLNYLEDAGEALPGIEENKKDKTSDSEDGAYEIALHRLDPITEKAEAFELPEDMAQIVNEVAYVDDEERAHWTIGKTAGAFAAWILVFGVLGLGVASTVATKEISYSKNESAAAVGLSLLSPEEVSKALNTMIEKISSIFK